MSGDYTRFTFKPRKDYGEVLKQQGRVDLDADWNEVMEIVDRRWRSETIDVIGHCVVPSTPLSADPTFNPFLVIPTAVGAFDIGIGRMYVDGIQIENHGLAPDAYLPDLGEVRGTRPVHYGDQPYLPAPLPPPLNAAANTTDLVYADVWQREVTALEDPSLREIALGGPDTATRVQSAWQVRVLENVGEHGCVDKIAAWDQATAASAGRLTTSTVAPPASDDPCIISPTGGYCGLENRLYRVEIHATGPIGGAAPAKFKWSRYNASVASGVSAIPSPTQVKVQQIGRDQVLRFEIGQWVEITEDFRELQGLAGHMAKVTAINQADRILTFAPAIPGTIVFDPTDSSRHTRVRRWDQSQNVDANGLLDVVAGPIEIEKGIRVTFTLDPAGGGFKVGDYWVFAARTADGSVEDLQQAPPRGILHHYCRLGFIHWGADLASTRFTDCRDKWPTLCCEAGCTVTVGDGVDSHGQFTDIQQAINALGNRGGVVCIGRGFFNVRAGLVVDATKRNVVLRGMGPATRIVFASAEGGAGVFLTVRGTEHVVLEDVFVAAAGAEALVRFDESQFCRVEGCTLVNLPGREAQDRAGRAIDFLGASGHCEIVHNALVADKAVVGTRAPVTELLVRDNQSLCRVGAVVLHEAHGVEIVHNQLRGLTKGLLPPADVALTRDNIDGFQLQVARAFRAPATAFAFQATGVLVYSGNRVVIRQNLITAHVGVLGFLLLNARIHQNDVLSLVGVLFVFGLLVKVEDNFVLGLWAGLVHAGLLADLDCTSNEWLGLYGIVWMTLGQLWKIFAPFLGGALAFLGFGDKGITAVKDAVATGATLAGALESFGLTVIAKVHRNVFFTLLRAIYKSDAVTSADVSIVDNTVSLCTQAGIELGGDERSFALLATLGRFISARHLVQGNALAVLGRGIVSAAPVTLVDRNSIQGTATAVELDAIHCAVRDNVAVGLGARPTEADTGLVVLQGGARNATVTGNQLLSAPGHAILIDEDVSDLIIDDNVLRDAKRTAIGTRTDAIAMRRARISRNRVEGCGSAAASGSKTGGALVVGEGEDVRVLDNTFVHNAPAAAAGAAGRWFAIYLEDVNGAEVSGNTVTGNAADPNLRGTLGAVGLPGARGVIRIQGNVVRGNGGLALLLGATESAPGPVQRALVQDNHFAALESSRDVPLVRLLGVDSMVFEGNQCLANPQGYAPMDVMLWCTRGNISGNTVENGGMYVAGSEVVVNANSVHAEQLALMVGASAGAGRAIVTSNLTTGLAASATGQLVRANNIPAP